MRTELQQVLDCIKEIGPCGARTVADTLDIDRAEVKEMLDELQNKEFVKRQSNKQYAAVKTSKPAPAHPWRQYPEGDDEHLQPAGPTTADMMKDGKLSAPDVSVMQKPEVGDASAITKRMILVNTATTDELIEQVKQGEKAREELRRRVEGLL